MNTIYTAPGASITRFRKGDKCYWWDGTDLHSGIVERWPVMCEPRVTVTVGDTIISIAGDRLMTQDELDAYRKAIEREGG